MQLKTIRHFSATQEAAAVVKAVEFRIAGAELLEVAAEPHPWQHPARRPGHSLGF